MSNYNLKRAAIYIRTSDGREFRYVKPTVTGNGTLVNNYYEYAATLPLAGVGDVISITLLTGCSVNGNYGINLRNLGNLNTALTTTSHSTPILAAAAIAATSYASVGYSAYSIGATVNFVCNSVGVKTGATTLTPGATGVTVVGGAAINPIAGVAASQAFTDFSALRSAITGTGWLSFTIDTTNNTLNYYTSNEKDIGGSNIRPIEMVSIQITQIVSIAIEEVAANTQFP